MCQTENVVGLSLARASIGALAATAWLIFGIGVTGNPHGDACAHTRDARIVIGAWSTYRERAYCSGKSRWSDRAELEIRQDEPLGKRMIHFQCKSGACA